MANLSLEDKSTMKGKDGGIRPPLNTDLPVLAVRSKASLIHIGSLDSFDITAGGKEAAQKILDYLSTGNRDSLKKAIDIYDNIIPNENFGGEYTALQWICRLFLAPDEHKKDFLAHPAVSNWFDLLAKDGYSNLKEYLQMKYHFVEIEKDDPNARTNLRFLEDFILFNNPDRERWDKIAENIYKLGINEGFSVMDFGCGPGYFTFKFADLVGTQGHVYGIETNDRHISYVQDYLKKYNISNISIYEYKPEDLGLQGGEMVDVVFMCSLYHILYAALTDGERDLFVKNIKNHLKEGGRLIIVDNDLVESEDLPYHGPYISRDLIISQLWHYGFYLIDQYQFTVQRYILEFRLKDYEDGQAAARFQAPACLPPRAVPASAAASTILTATTLNTTLTATPNTPLTATITNLTPAAAADAQNNTGTANYALPAAFASEGSVDRIAVTSSSSLVRYRMIGTSSQGYTLLGKKAARLFFAALEKRDDESIKAALAAYDDLIPKERIGDEYTVFKWFCLYLLAGEEQRAQMISDRFDAEFFNYLADGDYELLKKYVRIKYDLSVADPEMPKSDDEFAIQRIHDVVYEYSGNEVSFDQLNEWNEFISFNNPNRESWERTGEMLDFFGIKAGETVADIGCGFGFFSFKFAGLVGDSGRVYSTEINTDALAYVKRISDKYGLNINTVEARLNDICLPQECADVVFMCSMYHAVYIASIESVKDQFIASLKKAMKKDGRLIIVDNAITPPDTVAYFGSGIAKELAISQLSFYGFRLEECRQFIPQRYVLILRQE